MRTWVFGGCLAAVAAGGVYYVLSGTGAESHCGGCVACATAPVEPEADPSVVEVVNVRAVLAWPAPRPELPTVSFDEPPLAKRPPATAPDLIPIAYSEPADTDVEMAPLPRPTGVAPGGVPFATPDDPF